MTFVQNSCGKKRKSGLSHQNLGHTTHDDYDDAQSPPSLSLLLPFPLPRSATLKQNGESRPHRKWTSWSKQRILTKGRVLARSCGGSCVCGKPPPPPPPSPHPPAVPSPPGPRQASRTNTGRYPTSSSSQHIIQRKSLTITNQIITRRRKKEN